MKRTLLFCLLALFFVPAVLAETITVDLSAADEEELLAVREKIENHLSVLRSTDQDASQIIHLTGSGTSIKSGLKMNFTPARITFISSSDGSLTLTGGKYDHSYIKSTKIVEYIEETGTFEALIETEGDWELTIDPIQSGGVVTVSGSGPYIGSFFDLSGAVIVTLKASGKNLDSYSLSNFIVNFNHQYDNINAWRRENLANQLLSAGDTFFEDAIISPTEGRAQYFWQIKCAPEVEWSISLK